MAKKQQDSAERIAKALRRVERAMAALHEVLHREACDHAEQLGIDVAPLSGGTPKPPRD